MDAFVKLDDNAGEAELVEPLVVELLIYNVADEFSEAVARTPLVLLESDVDVNVVKLLDAELDDVTTASDEWPAKLVVDELSPTAVDKALPLVLLESDVDVNGAKLLEADIERVTPTLEGLFGNPEVDWLGEADNDDKLLVLLVEELLVKLVVDELSPPVIDKMLLALLASDIVVDGPTLLNVEFVRGKPALEELLGNVVAELFEEADDNELLFRLLLVEELLLAKAGVGKLGEAVVEREMLILLEANVEVDMGKPVPEE